jgi:TatD DNase family protein
MAQGAFPGLLHCFSSGQTLANTALDLGLYISLSGIVTFKSAKDLQETAKLVPEDRLLVETDSPYLAPVPKRGKRNEPSFVVHTAQKVADLRGVEAAQLANTTTENFFRLFSKVPQIAMAGGVG